MMKQMYIILLFLMSFSLASGQTKSALIKQFNFYKSNGDELGMRMTIKKLAATDISFNEWHSIRKLIHKNLDVGYDLVFKWDNFGMKKFSLANEDLALIKVIKESDDAMLVENFDKAFLGYQKVAQLLKAEIKTGKKEQLVLYYSMLHYMGRALYGAKRYQESVEVYGWIDQSYPRIRQVIFERMWAAFRLGRIDIANGMIVSQQSSYFSPYMEPESYLVQVYIYKRLCREDELKVVRLKIQEYLKKIKENQVSFSEWAKEDIETYSLISLIEKEVKQIEGESEVNVALRKKEQAQLKGLLMTKFESDKNRIMAQLDKVVAYSYIAMGSSSFKTSRTDLKNRDALLKEGLEFWPVDDAEDWVDEIGSHLYIGDSKCEKPKRI